MTRPKFAPCLREASVESLFALKIWTLAAGARLYSKKQFYGSGLTEPRTHKRSQINVEKPQTSLVSTID